MCNHGQVWTRVGYITFKRLTAVKEELGYITFTRLLGEKIKRLLNLQHFLKIYKDRDSKEVL